MFADDIILYTESLMNSQKNLFGLINEFGKAARYKINIQKLVFFLYTNNE